MSLLRYPHIFPLLMCLLYVGAVVRYACARDWGRVLYWLAALQINFAATWLVGKR